MADRNTPQKHVWRAQIVLLTAAGCGTTEIMRGESLIGGGSTPEQSIETWLVAVTAPDVVALDGHLRASDPPVIARIERDLLLVVLRSVFPEEKRPPRP